MNKFSRQYRALLEEVTDSTNLPDKQMPTLTIPDNLSERRKIAIADAIKKFEDAYKTKKIYNVLFNDLKNSVKRGYDEARDTLNKKVLDERSKYKEGTPEYEKYHELYWMIPYDYNGLDKFMRAIESYKGLPIYIEHVKFGNDWKAFRQVFKDLKPYIIKGRIPDPNAVPRWEAPIHSVKPETFKLIQNALEKIVAEQYVAYVENLTENHINMAKRFVKEMQEKEVLQKDLRDYFKGNDYYRDIANRLTESTDAKSTNMYISHYRPNERVKVKLIPNYAEKAKAMATSTVDAIKLQYISKNTSKLATIIDKKKLSDIKIRYGSLGSAAGFSGQIDFTFDDKSAFTVDNKVVTVWPQYGQPFMRFPTTFHDIKFSDGTFKKMLSEQEMNEVWN